MRNWLINNWSVIITILITLGIPVVKRIKRQKKQLSFAHTNSWEIMSTHALQKAFDLEIIFDDKQINSLNSYEFQLMNTGNILISKDDFLDPMKFAFTKLNIIGFEILRASSDQLKDHIQIEIKEDDLFILPFDLNIKEFIKIRVLTEGYTDNCSKDIRIKELKCITEVKKPNIYLPMIAVLVGLLFGGIVDILNRNALGLGIVIPKFANDLFKNLTILSIVLMILSMIRLIWTTRKLKNRIKY